MVKDSKRFADSGGWGYGAFEYEAASDSFRPANTSDRPPQDKQITNHDLTPDLTGSDDSSARGKT
jgi:hypothetical protein